MSFFYTRGGLNPYIPPENSGILPVEVPKNSPPAQPEQRFKFVAATPPRVDNTDQPWYGANSRAFARGPEKTLTYDPLTHDASGTVRSMSGVWGSLNQIYGGQTSDFFLNNPGNIVTNATSKAVGA